LYAVVQEAQRRAREGVRAGMTGREADALARDRSKRAGWRGVRSLDGSGLGLESRSTATRAHRQRSVARECGGDDQPGVYIAGSGGVRIEDDVHLSSDGPVLLTDGRTDLVELV
jgi:Xaa-Pro aminopeptidase